MNIPRQKILAHVYNVAKIYNVGTDTLIKFLKNSGFGTFEKNTILSELQLNKVHNKYFRDKLEREKVTGKPKISWITSDEIPHRSDKKTEPAVNTSKFLHIENDQFFKVKQIVRYSNYPEIRSHFTNLEARHICAKMSSSFTRRLCTEVSIHSTSEFANYQLHSIANKALRIFGGKILSFVYSLRPLKFKNNTAIETQTYNKVVPDFPIMTFSTKGSSFKIAFFVKKTGTKDKLEKDIRVFDSKTFKLIGTMTDEGDVLIKLNDFKPRLTIFYEESGIGEIILTAGVEEGNCDLCNLPLTVPLSLRLGIGPVCAKKSGVDRSIYQY